ncbi:MAG: RNA polymerase sigma factor SigZ [Bacillaceae bacterium]|nr:RNA polymerase sigma factor SigZ [Bacillaceae bacterium]
MTLDTNAIWEAYRNSLRQFIHTRISNEHEADDILQEVFIKIHHYLPGLKDEEKLIAWIYQITRHTIVDYYRKRDKRKEDPVDISQDHTVFKKCDQVDDDNLNAIVAGWLRELMQQLPEIYREALILTEFKNLTQKEMANKLGISISGAKSRVQRARKKLKQLLLDCCHLEMDLLGNVLDYHINKGNCSCQEILNKSE